MKASNNLYQDLKESFDEQNRTMMRLSVFKEDTEALIAKKDIEMRTAAQKSQEELDVVTEEKAKVILERDKINKELATLTVNGKALKDKLAAASEQTSNLKMELDEIHKQQEEDRKEAEKK